MSIFFKNIWLILSLDCEGSARLTSDSFDRNLNWAESTALFMHRFICAKSRNLDKQLLYMNDSLTNLCKSQLAMPSSLSEEARERIRCRVQELT